MGLCRNDSDGGWCWWSCGNPFSPRSPLQAHVLRGLSLAAGAEWSGGIDGSICAAGAVPEETPERAGRMSAG